MNTNSKYLLGSIVALVLVVTGVTIFSSGHSTPTPVTKTTRVAGGAPDLSNSPYLTVNGVTEWYSQQPMVSNYSTTTVCSIANPTPATSFWTSSSTLQYVSARFGATPSASSTTVIPTFWIATSTNPYGTTTATAPMYTGTVGTSTAGGWIPTTWGGGVMGTTTYTLVITNVLTPIIGGLCQEEFTQY